MNQGNPDLRQLGASPKRCKGKKIYRVLMEEIQGIWLSYSMELNCLPKVPVLKAW
jgi:hypothetical protein